MKGMTSFNSAKHLCFEQPSKIYSMADLQLPEDTGVSPMAVSEPFPLFTEEATMAMRTEVLSASVFRNCSYSSNLSPLQLRGFATKYAPFITAAWKDPQTLSIISKIAGTDLVPVMDFEIAHINLSWSAKTKATEAEQEEAASVQWHRDSYPFVCVVMLSDSSNMLGGETAVKTGTGEVLKVRGPQMGSAVVLQGRYITHRGLRALGFGERITMVTSFRPKCPFAADDSILRTVRPVSNLQELYSQFVDYRLHILEQRLKHQRDMVRKRIASQNSFDLKDFKAFIVRQERFLADTRLELVDEAEVTAGEIDDPI